ncbi:hypothetical protein COB55_03170 [Candidatus Wolfebacteria bacterium]|nr:MAG: hypothetical protein COB55_03170 [Candidatus Wolfebacteria bacterium]
MRNVLKWLWSTDGMLLSGQWMFLVCAAIYIYTGDTLLVYLCLVMQTILGCTGLILRQIKKITTNTYSLSGNINCHSLTMGAGKMCAKQFEDSEPENLELEK